MRGSRVVHVAMAILLLLLLAAPSLASAGRPRPPAATVDALLDLDVRPFAIGHRGYGANSLTNPPPPIEDTVAAVRKAFEKGITIVEVDVQLTRDEHVVVYHDDVLPDHTCLNALTLRELEIREPFIPTLQAVLEVARGFNRASGPLQGLVIVELKAAAPLCDPRDHQDRPIVNAATRVIRHMRMTEQVLLASLSPAILDLARIHAPEIARVLTVSGLQFLTQKQIEDMFGHVTLIEKKHGLGLQWAEAGNVFRLPGYRSPEELIHTALLLEARVIEADLLLLDSSAGPLVQTLHALGLKVFGWTVDEEAQWNGLQSLGVDGIYVNDIALGLAKQATIP